SAGLSTGLGDTFLLVRVAAEHTRQTELTQLMTDHILRHEDVIEMAAVMNLERVTDELRHNRASARPGPQWPSLARLIHRLHTAIQLLIYEWTFFQRTSHDQLSVSVVSTNAADEFLYFRSKLQLAVPN